MIRLVRRDRGDGDRDPVAVARCEDGIAAGRLSLGPVQTYTLDQIRPAHDDMENNRTIGKQVAVL